MKNLVLIMFAFLLSFSSMAQGCDFEYVGNPGFSGSTVETPSGPSIAIHPTTGELYSSYQEVSGGCIVVYRFDGLNWVLVGGPCLNLGGFQHQKSLMFDSSSELYLAVSVPSITYPTEFELAVYHYDFIGDTWNQVGDFIEVVNTGGEVCLKEHPISNELYVAYPREEVPVSSFYNRINVKKFDGIDWVQVGQVDISQDKAFSVSLDFESDGTPILAYVDGLESEGNGQATVKKLVGGLWETVGSERFTFDPIRDITIHYDENQERVTIAFVEDVSLDAKTSMMYFDGFTWIYLGGSTVRVSSSSSQSLDFDFHPVTGEPFIMASWDGLDCLYRFDGNSWFSYGGIQGLSYPSMEFHPITSEPYVAFRDGLQDGYVSVATFPCISGDGCIYPGCTDASSPSYDPTALCDDGSCIYLGCTYEEALNWDPMATQDDGSCELCNCNCQPDFNGDEFIDTQDLLIFLAVFGTNCQ